jgi:hypothetical protein
MKSSETHTKDFCEKKCAKVTQFFEDFFFSLKLSYLDNKFQEVTKIQQDS